MVRPCSLVAALLSIALGPWAAFAGQTVTDPSVEEDRIRGLRAAASWDEASAAARTLLGELRADSATPTWRIERVEQLLATLETIAPMPEPADDALAEAMRLQIDHRRAFEDEELARARELAERELAIEQLYLGERHPEVATTLCDLGLYHDRLWHERELGEARLRDCLAIRRETLSGEHPDLAAALQLLGTYLRRSDSWDEAETLMREGLAIRRSVLGDAHPDTARSMHHLAILLVRYRRLDEAQALYEQALVVHRKHLTYRSRLLPENMVALALVHRDRGDLDAALPLFFEALEVTRRRVGDESWYVSWIQNYIGAVLMYGGHHEASLEVLLEAEARLRRIDPMHRQLFQILDTRGRLALAMRDYEEAERLLDEALRFNRRMRGTDANAGVALSLQRLAIAKSYLDKPDEAEALLEEAVAAFEGARARVTSGLSRARFSATPYVPLAVLRLEQGKPARAWDAVERARGRVLTDLLTGAHDDPDPGPAFPLARVRRSLDEGTAIVGWLDYHLYSGEPRYWGYVIRDRGPVHWVRLRDLGTAERRRAAVPGSEVRSFDPDLALPHELRARLLAFRGMLSDAGASAFEAPVAPRELWDEAGTLWRERFAPLEPHLAGVDRLVVVSSWAMGGIPLDAMRRDDGEPLGLRYAMAYVPSATTFARLTEVARDRRPGSLTGLLLGDPPFRLEHLVAMRRGARGSADGPVDRSVLRGVLDGSRTSMASLPRLPWSRDEVRSIAGHLVEPLVLVGEDASERRLRELGEHGSLLRYDVIHLATHAVVDSDEPERSALVLSQLEPGGATDGMLTAGEVLRDWRIRARLVSLSACETGLGENLFGEGVVSFAYPFLRAGADSLLVSLWKVDDRATAMLMDRFYANWLGERPGDEADSVGKARALRDAKRWLRDYVDERGERPYAHPYYWSAFVLVGDPG